MLMQLNAIEIRVIGCLIEKEVTTPDYYPMTLNGLVNACNQKSNRDPVVSLDEKSVLRALDSLRDKKLALMISSAGGRVPKYEHKFTEMYAFLPEDVAVLCVLMLRGPQTAGEIRGRTGRLYKFETLEEVESALARLMAREPDPMVMKLPRQAGRKESRTMHLFAGEPVIDEDEVQPAVESARLELQAEDERIATLEAEVLFLREQMEAVKQELATFRKQFE